MIKHLTTDRCSVIDLGTNTFHFLVVEHCPTNTFKEIYRERHFVKLAEEGLDPIGDAAFQRGINTIRTFHKKALELNVQELRLIGTAALRTASNGLDFTKQVKIDTGWHIELISGQEEARLIHKGVQMSMPFGASTSLIMDIGGGSVEFIICDKDKVYWTGSYPVGVAVLRNKFHKNDPITSSEIDQTNAHLKKHLQPLLDAASDYNFETLIGASGAFEVVENMLPEYRKDELHARGPASIFDDLYDKIILSTMSERLAMPGLPQQRADLIVVSFLIIRFILDHLPVQEIVTSKFAVKEGLLREMLESMRV